VKEHTRKYREAVVIRDIINERGGRVARTVARPLMQTGRIPTCTARSEIAAQRERERENRDIVSRES